MALTQSNIQDPSKRFKVIHFFDLIEGDKAPSRRLALDVAPARFIWRADRAALIVLFEDHSLQEYDFETEAWHFIAAIPNDEWWTIRRVACVD